MGVENNFLTSIEALPVTLHGAILRGNYRDLSSGSAAMGKIEELQAAGAYVEYMPQRPIGVIPQLCSKANPDSFRSTA